MHMYDKWLFVAGVDPIIRGFDLEDGTCKVFEGHGSWILCLDTHIKTKEDGTVTA